MFIGDFWGLFWIFFFFYFCWLDSRKKFQSKYNVYSFYSEMFYLFLMMRWLFLKAH